MNVRPIAVAIAAALAACTSPKVAERTEPPAAAKVSTSTPSVKETVLAAASAVAITATQNVADYSYRLLTPDATGIELVFDDGEYTYLSFPVQTPPNLMLFDQDGKQIGFQKFIRYAVIKGVYAGVLIRTPSSYSYAVPRAPDRVAAVRAGQGGVAQLPPELAAQRALILQTRAQLAAVEKRLDDPKHKTPQAIAAIHRELDELETIVSGLQAKMIRVYFASGRSDIALSATARAQIIERARGAERVVVRGRTDSIGSADTNQRVAWARANAAKQMLVSMGVPEPRIEVDRSAMADYIAPNNTAEGRAKNRRVEFVFLGEKPELAAQASSVAGTAKE